MIKTKWASVPVYRIKSLIELLESLDDYALEPKVEAEAKYWKKLIGYDEP